MANSFSADTNCVALWKMESGALITDSKGSNLLTDYNTVAASATCKEGSASLEIASARSEGLYIADGDLDANFPLKNGDATKLISVCLWFRCASAKYSNVLYSKWDNIVDKLSLALDCNGDGATFPMRARFGYNNGASVENKQLFADLVVNRWYHIGFTYQDSGKTYYAKLWDDTASSAQEVTSTATNAIAVDDGAMGIGLSFTSGAPASFFDGLIDEVVVFKDILTEAEIDLIRGGTYGASTALNIFQSECVGADGNLS